MKIRRPLASLLRGVPGAAAVWLRGGGWRWPRRGRSRCWPPVPAGFRRRPSVGGGSPPPVQRVSAAAPRQRGGRRQRRPAHGCRGRRCSSSPAAARWRRGTRPPAVPPSRPARSMGARGTCPPRPCAVGWCAVPRRCGRRRAPPLPSLLRAPGAARRRAPRREAPARRLSSGGCQRRQAQGAWGLARARCGARVTGAAAPSNPASRRQLRRAAVRRGWPSRKRSGLTPPVLPLHEKNNPAHPLRGTTELNKTAIYFVQSPLHQISRPPPGRGFRGCAK